jgi:hypothetical protein
VELWFTCKLLASSLFISRPDSQLKPLIPVRSCVSRSVPPPASWQRCGRDQALRPSWKIGYYCIAFEGGKYNPWLRGIWSDDTFLHDLSARSRTNLLQKTSCLLRVDSAIKRNDLANKTKACLVWGVYTTAVCLLPDVVPFQLSTPSPVPDVLPTCVCVCVRRTSARCTAVSYRCSQKFDLHLLYRCQKLREWLVPWNIFVRTAVSAARLDTDLK